jgi:ABC-2 type transport system ATP-binding protein
MYCLLCQSVDDSIARLREQYMSIAINASQLSRVYSTYRRQEGSWNAVKGFFRRNLEYKTALKPTSLTIGSGEIVGLVGANGAGKTTLLKILSGLIYPSSGEVSVLGFKPYERKSEFLRQISILLGQKAQLWWDLPAADSFNLLANIYSLDVTQAKRDWQALAERLNCTEQLHIQLRRLSLGERMKMEIIGSLLHRPRVLFLDEPTIGLDVLSQKTIRTFLQEYVKVHQPTIILTSHYMDDISQLADRLLLISQGALVYDGAVMDFVAQAKAGLNLDLNNEETDFEEVIHKFFEKESRRGKARDPLST